jgi:hypothetical protein
LKRTYCPECGATSVSRQFEALKRDGHHACGGMTKTDRPPAERGDLRDQLRQMMMKHVADYSYLITLLSGNEKLLLTEIAFTLTVGQSFA